jgi:hypothetical protein
LLLSTIADQRHGVILARQVVITSVDDVIDDKR